MRRKLSMALALTTLLSVTLIFTVGPASASTLDNSSGRYEHIFYIMMENHSTNEIFGNTADAPYINSLVSQYGSATQYFGVTHPSLPNYLAAISGNFQGIWDDCAAGDAVICAPQEFGPTSGYTNGQELLTPQEIASASVTPHMFSAQNIVDQLEGNGLSWKAYMQSMPYTGYTGEYWPYQIVNGQVVPIKLYAQKHNPFMYFTDIRSNPDRVEKIVPFSNFEGDLQSGQVPNFVFIAPDQCHDMHGVSTQNAQAVGIPNCAFPASGLDHSIIQLGDAFLQSTINAIMSSHVWKTEKSAIVIPWDENDYTGYTGCCHSPVGVGGAILGGANAPFIAITSTDADHIVDSTTPYNHYSLLATIEKLWNLGCLDQACSFDNSQLMTKFFR